MIRSVLKKVLCFGIILCGISSLTAVAGRAAYAQNTKKVGQLNFQVADDWPIEKRGGLLTPVPTEEYLTIKLKEIEKEFLSIRNEFSEGLNGIEADLESITRNLSKETRESQSQSEALGKASKNGAEALSRIELLRSKMSFLDKNVAAKILGVEKDLKDINREVEFIKDNMDGLQTQIYHLEEKLDYLQEGQGGSY